MSDSAHLPVMVDEVVHYLVTRKDGAYLDLTVGAGGHLRAVAGATSPQARLYGVDRDPQAVARASSNLKDIPKIAGIVCSSYKDIESITGQFDCNKFDGILLDLGISSVQLDDPDRGFSFRYDTPLDMRFDPSSTPKNAADMIMESSEKELARIIFELGEEKQARKIARRIAERRQTAPITTTGQLADIVTSVIRQPHQTKALARVFQAIRIAVNRELDHLTDVLPRTIGLLTTGARLVVLTYHSLEDRIVKRFFQLESKGCICPPDIQVCVCNHTPSLKVITRKSVTAQEAEVNTNPRARSARLRAAERL